MNWQLIIGILFIIGSFGCIADGFINFLLALSIGCGFLYIGLRKKGWLKKSTRHTSEISGYVLAYGYDDVKFYPPAELISDISKATLRPGANLCLVKEPQNTYDHSAVALYLGKQKIGYLLKNRLQDMANEYISKGWPVKASLVSLKKVKGEYQGYIALSFFRPGEK